MTNIPVYFEKACVENINNEIHLFGNGNTSYANRHYKWDGTEWALVSTLSYSFYRGCSVQLNNDVYLLGGVDVLRKFVRYCGMRYREVI